MIISKIEKYEQKLTKILPKENGDVFSSKKQDFMR